MPTLPVNADNLWTAPAPLPPYLYPAKVLERNDAVRKFIEASFISMEPCSPWF